MIQLLAVLTNDYEYMKRTNMVGTEFDDIWSVPYVSRTHIKKALTPKLYGSSKHARDLWDSNKLEYTQQQLNKISEELATGIYANANNFKDFIINNVNPQITMEVKVWNDTFTIECNRFKWKETKQVTYSIYTSSQGLLKKVSRNVNLVYDTNQFKRFFVTLLLHGMDSQIANEICGKIYWVLPNHDSFCIHPNDAKCVRDIYTNAMLQIYKNRKQILKNYFTSIGIDKEYREQECDKLITKFSPYCLK